MPAVSDRPVLFLDIDGTLIPFAARPRSAARRLPPPADEANPLLDRLDANDGSRLLALGLTDRDFQTIRRWLAVES